MSWWDGTGREGYWESQIKRPSEDAVTCPRCGNMAKRKAGSNDEYRCSNCDASARSVSDPSSPAPAQPCPYILNGSFDEHEGARYDLVEGHAGKHHAISLGKTLTWPSTRSRRADPAVAVPGASGQYARLWCLSLISERSERLLGPPLKKLIVLLSGDSDTGDTKP